MKASTTTTWQVGARVEARPMRLYFLVVFFFYCINKISESISHCFVSTLVAFKAFTRPKFENMPEVKKITQIKSPEIIK